MSEETAMVDENVAVGVVGQLEIPKAVPYNVDDLTELRDMLANNINVAPRGSKTFVDAASQYLYHNAFLNPAMQEMTHALAYMNGDRGLGVTKERKEKVTHNRARKFFDSLNSTHGEAAIRKQCIAHNLDYDAFETVDERIDALVAASTEVV